MRQPEIFLFGRSIDREARKLLRFDRAAAARADASIFVSESEADLFRARAPEVREKVTAISNGIDAIYFSPENAGSKPDLAGHPVLVFTGQMDYWPNVDAVVWFSENILPTIREKLPTAAFYIVGAHPSARRPRSGCAARRYGCWTSSRCSPLYRPRRHHRRTDANWPRHPK